MDTSMHILIIFSFITRRPPTSTLFPYTTLFRPRLPGDLPVPPAGLPGPVAVRRLRPAGRTAHQRPGRRVAGLLGRRADPLSRHLRPDLSGGRAPRARGAPPDPRTA